MLKFPYKGVNTMAFFFKQKEMRLAASILIVILLFPIMLLFHPVERPESKIAAAPANGEKVSRGVSVSRQDLILMARVIEGEAADEPYQGKVAVGAVIVNRLENPAFPKSVPGVVFEPDAFEAVTNGQYTRPLTRESLAAAEDALNGQDPTSGALYYWNPAKATSTWVWSRPIVTKIGNHVFAR